MFNSIRKRDDRIVPFDLNKIENAIMKAAHVDVDDSFTQQDAHKLALRVNRRLKKMFPEEDKIDVPSVEEVQEIVEDILMESGFSDIAKEYIRYRYKRNTARDKKKELTKILYDIMIKDSEEMDLKRENANIRGDTTMGVMLRVGSETSKDIYKNFLMSPKFKEMHENGDIH